MFPSSLRVTKSGRRCNKQRVGDSNAEQTFHMAVARHLVMMAIVVERSSAIGSTIHRSFISEGMLFKTILL
jgi:hypothetical protein